MWRRPTRPTRPGSSSRARRRNRNLPRHRHPREETSSDDMAEVPEELAPTGQDERYEDREYNVAIDPSDAKAWLNLLRESEEAFEQWNDTCDNIEKLYAS